jgi:hypothetical protein
MSNLGERALLLRIIGAGIILVLLVWSLLSPPAWARPPAPLKPQYQSAFAKP